MRPDGYLVPAELDPKAILAEVARGFRVSVDEILSDRRARHIATARLCAMAVVREATDLSYPAIGNLFNRDHTTVRAAYQKLMADDQFARSVRLVVAELSPPPTLFAVPDQEVL